MPAGRQLQRPGPNLGQIAIGDVKHLQVLVDIVGDIQVVAVQAVGGSPRHAAQRRSTSPVLERCFDDGRLALDNNLAAPALRCVAIGRQNDLLAGSDTGGHRVMYSLIETAELNGLDHSSTSPTCLFAPAIIQPGVSPNCFPGTGSLPTPARAPA